MLKSSRRDSQMSKVQGRPRVLLPGRHDRTGMQMLQQVTTMEIPVHQPLFWSVHLLEPAPQCNTRIAVMKHVCIALIHSSVSHRLRIYLWWWRGVAWRGVAHRVMHRVTHRVTGSVTGGFSNKLVEQRFMDNLCL